jgi:hypothetical protein
MSLACVWLRKDGVLMPEIVVEIQEAKEIHAPPEQVWLLLASPAVWSLRRGRFAFYTSPPDRTRRLSLVLGVIGSGTLETDVFEVSDEVPSQSLTMSRVSVPKAGNLTFCLSAAPGEHGATAAMTVRERVDRVARIAAKNRWQKQLTLWLGRCQNVLEGRTSPPAEGIRHDVRAAFTARPPAQDMEKVVSVSASAVISASPDRTWQVVWDPATSLVIDSDVVAAG